MQRNKETNIYLVDLLSETSSCHIDRERWTLLYKEARLCCFDFFMLTDVPSAPWWVQHLTTLEGIMLQWLQGQGEFLAVQDSSIGDLVTQSVSESGFDLRNAIDN